jgi:hypothetical protein
VRSAAETFRANPKIKVETIISQLGVGEALVSFLDEKGTPGMVERAFILPPHSQIGPISSDQRKRLITNSVVAGVYEQPVDRESAYEMLRGRASQTPTHTPPTATTPGTATTPAQQPQVQETAKPWYEGLATTIGGIATSGRGRSGRGDSLAETMTKSAVRTIGTSLGREVVRGVLGSLLGGSTTGRRR